MTMLFANDWINKYPHAKPHYNTTNRSWVDVCKLYADMGIKNHMFPLALHDQDLADVDPFDPNLSVFMIGRILLEVKINPWYFFRECARIAPGSGEAAVPLQANRGNIAMYWCFFNHVTQFLIQIRQTGKSVSADQLMIYLLNVRCKDTQLNLLTKDHTLRVQNIKRVKDAEAELPSYLRMRTKNDPNNTEMIGIGQLGNTLIAHVAQPSEKGANNLGRGLTSPIMFVDEGPFQVNCNLSIPAAFAATGDAIERAHRNDEPYGNVFTTTAGKKDTKEGKFFYSLLQGAAEWTEAFFDAKDAVELEAMVRSRSRSNMNRLSKKGEDSKGVFRVNITLDHLQLGKNDEWLEQRIERAMSEEGDPQAVDRDFFNRWTSGNAESPLDVEQLETMRSSQREPSCVTSAVRGGYMTNWFVPRDRIDAVMNNGTKYVLAMDTSNASGGDDISLRVTDSTDGKLIASGTYNRTNFNVFSEWVAHDWFVKYPNVIGIIENRSTGQSLIDTLLMILPSVGIDPFKRLFNRVVNERYEDPERFADATSRPLGQRDVHFYSEFKKHFGFATSGHGVTSRTALYGITLQAAARDVADVVFDRITIDQVSGLIMRDGRIDHPKGEHDDMCFIGSTLVRTNTGNRPIKDIKLGDLVLTREGYKPVIELFKSDKEVITRHGMTGTANHPFITPNGEVQLKDLEADTPLYVWDEDTQTVKESLVRNQPGYSVIEGSSGIQTVYNFMVEDCHEYFVNDILVHNCIAWLLGHWFLTQAKNLDYYGFNVRDILSRVRVKAIAEKADEHEYDFMLMVRNEIDNITKKLQDENDPIVSARLEAQLKFTMNRIRMKDTEVLSLQELIGKIRTDKAERIKESQGRRGWSHSDRTLPRGSYGGGTTTTVSDTPRWQPRQSYRHR